MTIRILLVDDERLLRTGFSMILRSEPDLAVVGQAADGHAPRGLLGMRERLAVYGGTLSTTHATGEGFVVRASFPLPQQVR